MPRHRKLRIGFFGRGDLGLRLLEAMEEVEGTQVVGIFTCRATPEVGEATEEDFESFATRRAIPFAAIRHLGGQAWEARLSALGLDLGVTVSWLHRIEGSILRLARIGFLNSHGGLLPKYRGNACANWAILNGETELGVSVHLMSEALDAGPVIAQERIPISEETTIGALFSRAQDTSLRLLLGAVSRAATAGTLTGQQQDERNASYCFPRLPRDGLIDWYQPAGTVARLVSASGRPYPGAYTYFALPGQPIRKVTIAAAHVQPHPIPTIYAVPGQIVFLGDHRGVVCGDSQLLVLEEVEVDGRLTAPAQLFTSVRHRVGLPADDLLADLEKRLRALEKT